MNRCCTLTISFILLMVATLAADDKKPDSPSTTQAQVKKDSFDTLLTDMIGAMKKATEVMKKAKDATTAKAAKPEMEKVVSELKGIQKRFEQVGKPSKEEEASLEKKYKQNIDEAKKAFEEEYKRLISTDYGKDLVQLLQQKSKPGDK